MRAWKPIFIENSCIPRLLSYISPIKIGAITIGIIVFTTGKLDPVTEIHETIHFQQFLETAFVGFLLLYFWDWLWGYIILRDSKLAYFNIRAEQEAYSNEIRTDYLLKRKRWEWLWHYKL